MPAAARLRAGRGPLVGLALAMSGGALGLNCSGAHESAHYESPARLPVKPTTDVPALLGETIESLRQRLGAGQPLTADSTEAYAQLDPQLTDSVRAFRARGLLLLACYDVRTRRVHDLLLLGRHEDTLMRRATLRNNAPDYLVLPVFHPRKPGYLLGLRIVETGRD